MNTKIESLTPAQNARLIEYRQKWLAIGRSTDPSDRPSAEKAITRMYELIGKKAPFFWWSDGPAVGSIVRTLLHNNKGANLRANLWANLGENLWANLGENLGENLRENLRENLGENLWANLRANLGVNLWENLGENLRANLGVNLRENLRENLRANLGVNLGENLWANLWENLGVNLRENLGENLGRHISWGFLGAHESAWPAYYNFPDAELRRMFTAEQREKLSLWLSLSAGTGWWEPYENVVFMCERPKVQLVNSDGRLHCENGPAILCRDGWPVYALNGVRMTEAQVMTPAEKMNGADILKEPNADVRRELIRKVGIEMMLAHLPHKVLDRRGDYELLRIDFPDLAQDTRFLKMKNPSIGVWHLEGVERVCSTVQQAINWRAGTLGDVEWRPAQLT